MSSSLIGQEQPAWLQVNPEDVQTRQPKVGYQFNTEASYVAGSTVKQGEANFGDLEEIQARASLITTLPMSDTLSGRVGLNWERYSFGVPAGAILPNTLQSINLNLGVDMNIGEKWLMRIEVTPGIYSDFADDIDFRDLNAPLQLGFSYLVDSNLQWVFGLRANFRSFLPVLPGAGVRWQFADDWTLNAIFPQPRLEYRIDNSLTLHLGAELKGGTYVVRDNFGSSIGQGRLDSAEVDYNEARAGFGIQFRPHPAVNLVFNGGYVLSRSWVYHEEDLRINTDPAPFGSVSLIARW
ncbi:MAG: DUF6268 family outer membrane beta-barrel protein [Verrucomicrobiota bacterium]